MTTIEQTSQAAPDELTGKFPWRFIAIAFGISWSCWLLAALSGQDIFTSLQVGTVVVLGGFGPAIAGILMISRTGDPEVVREYWRRVFDLKRITLIWFVPILFLFPTTVLISYLITGTPLDTSHLADLLQNPANFVIVLIFTFLYGPFSEELGWRDYALDWLQARYSAFLSSILLGVIWWAWHLPLLAVEGSFLNVTADPVFLAGFLYTVLLYSVLFTWVYNNNRRSVLAIILLHFSINVTSGVLLVLPTEIWIVNSFVLTAVVALIVWLYGGKRLVRNTPTA